MLPRPLSFSRYRTMYVCVNPLSLTHCDLGSVRSSTLLYRGITKSRRGYFQVKTVFLFSYEIEMTFVNVRNVVGGPRGRVEVKASV